MSFEEMAALDEEMFRRVWHRVMPDQSLSPVALGERQLPVEIQVEKPEILKKSEYISLGDSILRLEEILEGQRQWQGRLDYLARQLGGQTALRHLYEGELRQKKRLEQLYFLLAGERYTPRPEKSWGRESRLNSLRRGFYLQMDWADFYGQLGENLPQIGLQELALELKAGALDQGRGIRGIL